MRSSGSVAPRLVNRIGRRRSADLDRDGSSDRVAHGAVPDEPAHTQALPVVTRATRPARGGAGWSWLTGRPRAGSSMRRRCSGCPLGVARGGRRHRLDHGRSSGRRCRPARDGTTHSREARHGPGGPARHRTCRGSAVPRMGASGLAGAESSSRPHLILELPCRQTLRATTDTAGRLLEEETASSDGSSECLRTLRLADYQLGHAWPPPRLITGRGV
jgi:hypothetical protein